MAADAHDRQDTGLVQTSKPVVFLSFAFQTKAAWIKDCVQPLLRYYGCKVLTGEKYHLQEINRGVANDIGQSNLLIAFLTKNERLANGEWMTSQWVLQEIGFAAGKGIPVVLVRDKNVHLDIGILGNVQYIDLDSEYVAFAAFPPLRDAVKSLLFKNDRDDSLAVCHLAKRGRKDEWNTQWWDFWLWIDGSDDSLDLIADVTYEFPNSFNPKVEEGDPRFAFGDYGETDLPFVLRAVVRFRSGKRKIIRHKVTLPGTGISLIGQ